MKKEIRVLRSKIIANLTDILSETDDYSQDDIDEYEDIIRQFMACLNELPSNDKQNQILDIVKETVRSLNELNSSCEGNLIDLDQGDDICELMTKSALHAGFMSDIYNVIENLRDW